MCCLWTWFRSEIHAKSPLYQEISQISGKPKTDWSFLNMTKCCNCSACSSISLYYIKSLSLALIPVQLLITKLLFAIATTFSAPSLSRPTVLLSLAFPLSISLSQCRNNFHVVLYHQRSSDLMSEQPIFPPSSSEIHFKLNAAPFSETDIK